MDSETTQQLILGMQQELREFRGEFRQLALRTEERLGLMLTRADFDVKAITRAEYDSRQQAVERRLTELEAATVAEHKTALQWALLILPVLISTALLLVTLLNSFKR